MNAHALSPLPPVSYPFDELGYAARVKVMLVDWRIFEVRVHDYWPSTSNRASHPEVEFAIKPRMEGFAN